MDAKTLTHAKRLSRFAVIAAVIFAALTLIITPARALAHGEGVLQIGNEALTGEGMVAVGESTPVLRGTDGSVVLADGTFDSSTTTTSKCYGNVNTQNRFVPVIRWTSNNAIGKFQTKPPSGFFEDIQNTIDSALNMASTIPALVGNTLWGASASVVQFSVDFCAMRTVGPVIDSVAGSVGQAVNDSGLGIMLFIATVLIVLVMIVRGARRGGVMATVKKLGIPLLFVALFMGSVAGATQSKGTGEDFQPGTLSPAWMINKTSDALGIFAEAPMAAMNSITKASVLTAQEEKNGWKYAGHCSAALKSRDEIQNSQSVKAISDLWRISALRVYIDGQFGSPTNSVGWAKYCWILDHQAERMKDVGKDPADAWLLGSVGGTSKIGLNLKDAGKGPRFGWIGADGEEQKRFDEASYLGWVVCEPEYKGGWKVTGGNLKFKGDFFGSGDNDVTPDTCEKWWSDDTPPESLVLGDDQSKTASKANIEGENDNDDVKEAIMASLKATQIDIGASFFLMLSGFIAITVFGLLAIVILVAKIGAVIMGMFLIFVLIQGMLVGQERNVKRYLMSLLGCLVLSVIAQALVVLVTAFSVILMNVGIGFFGGSSVLTAMWAAASPALAVGGMYWASKKMFGTSPFTLKGAQGLMGGNLGALGAMGAASSISNFARNSVSRVRANKSSTEQRGVRGDQALSRAEEGRDAAAQRRAEGGFVRGGKAEGAGSGAQGHGKRAERKETGLDKSVKEGRGVAAALRGKDAPHHTGAVEGGDEGEVSSYKSEDEKKTELERSGMAGSAAIAEGAGRAQSRKSNREILSAHRRGQLEKAAYGAGAYMLTKSGKEKRHDLANLAKSGIGSGVKSSASIARKHWKTGAAVAGVAALGVASGGALAPAMLAAASSAAMYHGARKTAKAPGALTRFRRETSARADRALLNKDTREMLARRSEKSTVGGSPAGRFATALERSRAVEGAMAKTSERHEREDARAYANQQRAEQKDQQKLETYREEVLGQKPQSEASISGGEAESSQQSRGIEPAEKAAVQGDAQTSPNVNQHQAKPSGSASGGQAVDRAQVAGSHAGAHQRTPNIPKVEAQGEEQPSNKQGEKVPHPQLPLNELPQHESTSSDSPREEQPHNR